MTANRILSAYAKESPREKREAKAVNYDFTCDGCGDKWDAPGHIWWISRMYCPNCGTECEAA